MKELFAAIVAFFTSLFSIGQPPPVPLNSPQPTAQAALPTPAYPRASYTNNLLNYTLSYPDDTLLQESPNRRTVWDKTYTLRIDEFIGNSLELEALLEHDLNCSADGPNASISCRNTAIKPFTNQVGSRGFLVRRLKTITGPNAGDYKDTAYIFPLSQSIVILSVELPTHQNLQILTDVANWFTALP